MDENSLNTLGCKSIDDYDCLCNQEGLRLKNLISGCIIKKCGWETASSLPDKAAELCDCVEKGMKDEL